MTRYRCLLSNNAQSSQPGVFGEVQRSRCSVEKIMLARPFPNKVPRIRRIQADGTATLTGGNLELSRVSDLESPLTID